MGARAATAGRGPRVRPAAAPPRPLALLDTAFLELESRATPMHVGALFVLQVPARRRAGFAAELRALLARRLGASEVLTRRLARLPLDLANPCWVEADVVDLARHVRPHRLPPPGDAAQLEAAVARLHETPLDRRRPLWELHVIDGLASSRVALYLKTHHAGLDGTTAQLFLRALVSDGPRTRLPAVAAPAAVVAGARPGATGAAGAAPGIAALARAALRGQAAAFGALPALVRGATRAVLAEGRGSAAATVPRTPFNVAITGLRSFAACEFDLARARAAAARHGATLNDLVLAACGGALRAWLEARQALPAASLVAAVPWSTRAADDDAHAIRVSFMAVPLHTTLADPVQRLAAVHGDALAGRARATARQAAIPTDLPGLGLPWLLAGVGRLAAQPQVLARVPPPCNLIVSNVAGPPRPLWICGTRVLTYTPVSIPWHGAALNVTVYSYAGMLYFGLTACHTVVPDVARLAALLRAELEALARAAPAARRAVRTRRGPPSRARRAGQARGE